MIPPGASSGHRACSKSCCVLLTACISASVRNNLMSGCRRITPVAEQGASSRIRSKGTPSHQACGFKPSPWIKVAWRFNRFRLSCTRARRLRSMSKLTQAAKSGCVYRIWHVLPPGAQHASSNRRPGFKSKSDTVNWAAAS